MLEQQPVDLKVQALNETRQCKVCRFDKPITEFGISSSYTSKSGERRQYRSWACRSCKALDEGERRRRYPDTYRLRDRARSPMQRSRQPSRFTKFGITKEQYEAIEQDQKGLCLICGVEPIGRHTRLSIDHNHATGLFRGLICGNCNAGMGFFYDDPELLKKAARYLRSHSISPEFPEFRIGLDCDGILYAWEKTARFLLETYRGYKDIPPSSYWDYLREMITDDDWRWLWSEGIKLGLFRYGYMYEGTAEALRELYELGSITYITHRPELAVIDTQDWMDYIGFPGRLVILHNMEAKSVVVPHPHIFLDDKVDNVVDMAENTNAVVCLWARPWNQLERRDGKVPPEVKTVNSWQEFIDLAKEKAWELSRAS